MSGTLRAGAFCLALCACGPAAAEATSQATGNPNATLTAAARLDFFLNIGKFIFFRVGSSAYPAASGTIDTVAITSVPAIPPASPPLTSGNSQAVNWSGGAPTITTSNPSLPVEVRSNAGQISIRANVVTPLTSGSNSIPMSQVTVSSNNASLPAPVIPNSGSGAAVNVSGTSFSNLVTERSATWTFSLSSPTQPPAGTYTGQVSFTASSP